MFAKPKTVNDVLASFNRNIADLKDVADHHRKQAELHEEAVRVAMDRHTAAKAEVEKAESVAQRILALIG